MVSVVMPVFDGAAHVGAAVGSVLSQEGVELELLIHDDGSSDATPDLLDGLSADDERIDVSRAANAGPATSRNLLLARARGECVAFLDHDDVWPPGRLARQVELLGRAPRAPGVLGETVIFGEGAEPRRVLAGLLQAGTFRRGAIDQTGTFAPDFTVADDFDFLLRLIETCGPLEIEREVAVRYRTHAGQWTADLELTGQATAKALAQSLRRRRRERGVAAELPWRGG